MAESIRVGAHSCAINPKDKDAGPQASDECGRIFSEGWRPTLPSTESGRFMMADLFVFATEPPA